MAEAETENMLFTNGKFYRWATNTTPNSEYVISLEPDTFVLGEPAASSELTVQQMILEGLVGVYVEAEDQPR